MRVDGTRAGRGTDPARLRRRRRRIQLHRSPLAAARRARARRRSAERGIAPTERAEIRLYTAAVLRQIPEEPLQPVPMGEVFLATDEDVAVALRMDGYTRDGRTHRRFPSGSIAPAAWIRRSTSTPTSSSDRRPRTSTSPASPGSRRRRAPWSGILASLFTHFPEQQGIGRGRLLQREGSRPLYLDQPGQLDADDLAMYAELGVPREPFDRVALLRAVHREPDVAQHAALERGAAAQRHAAHVGAEGGSAVRGSAAEQGRRRRQGRRAHRLHPGARDRPRVHGPALLAGARIGCNRSPSSRRGSATCSWRSRRRAARATRTHHVATIRKVRNRLSNISIRCAGLVTDEGVGRATFPSGASRTARCMWSTSRPPRRTRRT